MKFPFVSTTNIFNKNYKGKLKNNAKEKQQQRQRKNNKNKIAANKEKVTKTTAETPTLIFLPYHQERPSRASWRAESKSSSP